MEIALLQAELERLFDLDSLLALARDPLGFDPEAVGGTAAAGSFAYALTRHCVQNEAVEALCDTIRVLRPDARKELVQWAQNETGPSEELRAGDSLGELQVLRQLGEGRVGICYQGAYGPQQVRLKVLRGESTRDRRGLNRFVAVTRMAAKTGHPSLPSGLLVASAGGRIIVMQDYVEGESLSTRLSRSGPIHIHESRSIIEDLLDALVTLHDRRLVHGDIRPENVLLCRDSTGAYRVILQDVGTDRLRAVPRKPTELYSTPVSSRGVAPEILHGAPPSPASDLYALGALIYELLSGKPPFPREDRIGVAYAHLHEDPPPPSSVAPRGWVSRDLDALILSLLKKDPASRPASAAAVMSRLETAALLPSERPVPTISDDEFNQRLEALLYDPENLQAAAALDQAVDEGADPERVADTFRMAASQLGLGGGGQLFVRKSLLLRAAKLYEQAIRDPERAEQHYSLALELDPSDDEVRGSLERLRRSLGKFEELIEMLLERGQSSETRVERGQAFFEIGRVYMSELAELDQALVAFTQALCEDPENAKYAEEVERLAGSRQDAWAEVLEACNGPLEDRSLPLATKNAMLLRVGKWYAEKISRNDMALPCFQSVVGSDPGNEAALEAMSQLYRKGQQWSDLGMVLSRWADATTNASKARVLRAEAGEVAERHLGDPSGARTLYETVLAEDPSHERASDGLLRLCEQGKDWVGMVKVLQARAQAQRGDEQVATLLRLVELYEVRLQNDTEAIKIVDQLLADQPDHPDVLRAIDRMYAKVGRFQELIEILERQVRTATTPRQKTALLERTAAIYEEEFMDHERAATALRAVLAIAPDHDAALTNIARSYRALDRWEEVAEILERHLDLVAEPSRKVAIALQLGRVLAEQLAAPDRAIEAFEQVLSFEPQHPEALEMAARLRSSLGDADAALAAINVLAAKATSPQVKAEHYLRAARLLESRNDLDAAIEHYKLALDANPINDSATVALRKAYLTRGDAHAAIQLLEQDIKRTEGVRAKAKLLGELSELAARRLHDPRRAEEAAKEALSLDPTNPSALGTLGDIAFEGERYLEASRHYSPLVDRIDSLEPTEAARLLVHAAEALARSDSIDRAHAAGDSLCRVAPNDVESLMTVGKVLFDKGDPARTAALHQDILTRLSDGLSERARAQVLFRLGESLRRSGKPGPALEPLEDACDLDPANCAPLAALAEAYAALERWHDVMKTKYRQLDIALADDRVQLLIDIGDLMAEKFGDRAKAAQSLVAALDDRPDDRRLLTKLMQLYSDLKDWTKLVEVIVKLAGFVDDKKQKAKYLNTAAIVCARQMGDVERALEFFEQVIELDPSVSKAFSEAVDLYRTRGDFTAVERLLRRKLESAVAADDKQAQINAHAELAELYERDLGWLDYAIESLENALRLEPANLDRTQQLANLCGRDPEHHAARAVAAHIRLLEDNAYRLESYKTMRRLHTETKNADGAWCLCQALSVMKLGDQDEERFYKRMRVETAAPAQAVLADYEWSLLTPSQVDPLLTNLFAVIEPAVVSSRTPELLALGYDLAEALDLAQTPTPMAQTLFYAAGVLGIEAPPCFVVRDDPGGLSFLHARTPGIGLGRVAMSSQVPPQPAAFIAARHLSYLRPGFYLRQLLTSGTGLKSWLFAAIKLISPQFPVAPDIEGAVREAYQALDAGLRGTARDELARVVSALLREEAALDLRRWVAGVDLTADRVGMLIAHDLQTAIDLVKASDESTSSVSGQDRLKHLAVFSVSPQYLELRQRLRIAVDS